MLCPTHLKTVCDEFQNGIQQKTLLLGGKPRHSFAASSTNEAAMKNAAGVRPKFVLLIHRIKGLDTKKDLPVEPVWNYKGETLGAPMQGVHLRTAAAPQGQEDGLPGGSRGQWWEAGELVEESEEIQRSLWIQRNSSAPPWLLWETSGACGESEVRRGLSGTKLQIHMICLAKRAKEKWIKAWWDQRNTTIKSRRLPWDQQEMHIIYKFFLSSVRCGGNWLLLFGGRAAAGGGEGQGLPSLCHRKMASSFVSNSSRLWSVSEATAAAPSTHDNRRQDRDKDSFVNPVNILAEQTGWG